MRKTSTRATTRAGVGAAVEAPDPRDREIERLRTLVSELTRRNEVLQEALRRLQGASR